VRALCATAFDAVDAVESEIPKGFTFLKLKLAEFLKSITNLTYERTVSRLAAGIYRGSIDPSALSKAPALGAYALIHWCFDTSTLEGYGFPFDSPHLTFYRRLRVLHGLIDDNH